MTFRATRCLACGGSDLVYRAAIVAPFVAARVFARRPARCRIASCADCGFAFFEDRYDDAETARLYADYRGEAYFRERHRWEPWYTRRFNDGLGSADDLAARRALYHETIARDGGGGEIGTVLDYGGDRGQLVAGGPGRLHHVYDISGVDPEPGVERIPDQEALGARCFDLVLACEVLEHLGDPESGLADVVRHVAAGGLLYVTVPNREFPVADIPQAGWYAAYLRTVLASRWVTLAADFWSTGYRVKFRRVPPLGFVKLHEHINFFDAGSLTRLLSRAGLEILSCAPRAQDRALVALCRRPAIPG